jgi:hypothetical protein
MTPGQDAQIVCGARKAVISACGFHWQDTYQALLLPCDTSHSSQQYDQQEGGGLQDTIAGQRALQCHG